MSEERVPRGPGPCEICGSPGATPSLVRFRQGSRIAYDDIRRCRDRDVCRQTALAAGREYWPVDVVTQSTRRMEARR